MSNPGSLCFLIQPNPLHCGRADRAHIRNRVHLRHLGDHVPGDQHCSQASWRWFLSAWESTTGSRSNGPEPAEAVRATYERAGMGTILAAFTTAVGFFVMAAVVPQTTEAGTVGRARAGAAPLARVTVGCPARQAPGRRRLRTQPSSSSPGCNPPQALRPLASRRPS